MHGLLAALSYGISGVRAHPQGLESVLLERLLLVATDIRNLLQYTPDMDVQVLQADGIVTLCLGPRDATAGIFVCKWSAAATSLHGVCAHVVVQWEMHRCISDGRAFIYQKCLPGRIQEPCSYGSFDEGAAGSYYVAIAVSTTILRFEPCDP
ncbi:hypothetical protein PsorP6_009721 [Peronosclerospora sorghi]|uniref:Uncharacterized protein n=1 Tax=Peronosclerospora sorghi TaxID=230839 RepID=A0ACC0VYG4_9STRA|nr:hypothetical protein PsorP6_009721 [Peronosclerospora sorghi]